MDPNAALSRMREISSEAKEPAADDAALLSELVDLVDGLDGWLLRGGYLPRDWATGR